MRVAGDHARGLAEREANQREADEHIYRLAKATPIEQLWGDPLLRRLSLVTPGTTSAQ